MEHIYPSMVSWAEQWETFRNDPRFGFVHYDDLKQDESAYLEKCARIVGVPNRLIRKVRPIRKREDIPNWGGAQSVR